MKKPFIIPVFIPHAGCPYQCAFCNQRAVTGVSQSIPSSEQLRSQINTFLKYKSRKRKKTQIAFFGGNFLGLKKNDIEHLLKEAACFVKAGSADSIRFSTRPDTIDNKQLDIIKNFPVSTIELGAQSMDDKVLALIKRGHTSSDTEKAVCLLKERNYETGVQLMVGLPGDNEPGAIATGHRIADMDPDFVRIYPAVVLADSLLGKWYKKGKYSPLSLESCVTLVKKLYILFIKKNILVIRMGLQASGDIDEGASVLAGPYHPAFGHLVHSEIFLDKAIEGLRDLGIEELRNSGIQEFRNTSIPQSLNSSIPEFLNSSIPQSPSVSILVNPRSISKMRGLKNKNIEILKNKFHIRSVKIIPDPSVAEEDLQIFR